MKKLMLVLILFMAFSSRTLSDEIPPGITYIKAPDEINMKVQEKLEQIFSQTPIKLDDLFGENVTCGPFLWARVRDMDVFRDLKRVKAEFVAPLRDGGFQVLEGALFRGKEQISPFCRAMDGYLKQGSRHEIRRPNAEELRIYWAIIPYDIEEPIFIADNDDHKLLMDFSNNSVFWIGDFQNVTMTEPTH